MIRMQRKQLRLFILAALLCLELFRFPATAQTQGPRTIFWQISGNGLALPSYLFGTIHIMPKDQFESYDLVDQKLKQSRQLILEMKVDVPLKQQIEWAQKLLLPKGQTLKDFMPEDDFDGLKTYVTDSLGVKDMLFNTYIKFKPFAFYSALIPSIIGENIEGYELYFSKIAKRKKIPVRQLETFDFQLGIFDSIPNEEQMKMFFSEDQDIRKELTDMLSVYHQQDIYRMAESFSDDSIASGFENRLIAVRNEAWIPKIIGYIQEEPSFIAVGAGHLAGRYGLIRQLREKGYDIEPVMLRKDP